ncbi:hypothetical protein DSCO28_68140 [Desulfosarcina ovata subsp. sediminis]|uniref:Lipoprotein n=1 Tax=Desulfosarcina ovata subsp. sediminis TaxID=885957 RepID=A0A5K8A1K6_9BACT|nr:hypothetical protein [Desulfosarcina ovata]BBO86248.1 hypothetical protein DSCO28_68140 [Desulfosarcina ovata subsp. sediminis]
MKTQMINFLSLCLAIASISACAISNEGATDFRYYNTIDNKPAKYIKPNQVTASQIKEGEALVVSIKQAYIEDFTEWPSPLRIARFEPANGEIAIVVNAFEQGNSNLNFGPKGLENARVVFFSDDVWEGQPLNLSNLSTIYGPLKYNGNNFIIDLYVVEFDQPGDQLKQLVTNLAELGTTFYPPASPIAGALSKLAGSLITDQQEDRIFHYTLELKPVGGDLNLDTGILLTGNYAFIRESNRKEVTNWADLIINPKTGRIVYKNKKINTLSTSGDNNEILCNCTDEELPSECYYRENTYIVIEVNKAISSLKNDTQQMIYKELVGELADTSLSIFRTSLPEDALKNLAGGVAELRNADKINKEIDILNSANNTLDSNNTALSSFLDLWFSIEDSEEGENVSKYKLNSIEEQLIERKIGELVASCESNQDTIISIMDIMRSRATELDDTNIGKIIPALSCKHK